MANSIEGALGANQVQGVSRLRGGASITYQPVQVAADNSKVNKLAQWSQNMQTLAKIGESAYMKYDANQKAKADERSNEIIRKFTPEQRRQAIKDGTLLYKDDPYAMQALKEKTGRNAAFLIDDDVSQKIQQGHFRTRQEMETYRQEQLTKGAKEYAEEFGIDQGDEFFQKGFNSDITQRNISLYGAHDNFMSERYKQGNTVQSKVELDSILSDPTVLRNQHAGAMFNGYIQTNLKSGAIYSDDQANTVIRQSLGDVVNREGGRAFLDSLENQKVTLNGTTSTYRQLLGDDAWTNLQTKASQSEYSLNAKRSENLQVSIGEAINQDDPAKGMEMLQVLKAENNKYQVGDEMTPQRQMLIQAETQLQDRVRQDTQQRNKQLVKAAQDDNKYLIMDQQFSKRLGGAYVPTDYKNMPANDATGEWSYQDAVNYANKKITQIDQMNIPDEQKDRMKMQYLRADADNGPFRQIFGTQVADAQKEWGAAVINGSLPTQGTPALDSLRRVMKADPSLIASLYPEQADLFNTMDMMDNMGVSPQVIIDADRQARTQTKDMRFESDKNWQDLKNNSKAPELSRIPTSLDGAARKIYDSTLMRTGNQDLAQQQTTKFLKENTVTFTADVDGDAIGVIPRNMLTVTSDPDSYKQGQEIIDRAAKQIAQANPWITNKQLTVYQQGKSIYLMDTTGQISVRYDQDTLQRVYADEQNRASQKATDEALKKANERAPIAQVGKAREVAAKRVRAKRASVPKFIYGRKEDE